MEHDMIATHLENIDRRLAKVEQILPTLATKEELYLAVREEGERSRRHMDVVTESLREDIHLIAAHVASVKMERPEP